jgi:hypothetical protein
MDWPDHSKPALEQWISELERYCRAIDALRSPHGAD